MKRRLIFFLLAMACPFVSVSAQTYEAVYVYLNDGGLNAFLKSDLDSIRFSTCDVVGMEHATWQTQEFYTTDSIYRIPISKIDSVRMVTPDPILARGVSLGRDSWLKYVKTYTEQTIIFNADIPAELIPEVGQVLLAYPNEEPIKEGFSGRVRSVTAAASGIVCSCEEVGISDLYERILIVGKAESENTENQSCGQKRDFATGTDKKVYLPSHITGKLEIGDDIAVSASVDNPSLILDYVLCYGEENLKDMVYFKCHFSSTGRVDVTAKVENDYDPKPKEIGEFPINLWGLRAALSFGTFFKASGNMDVSFSVPFEVETIDGFKYVEGEGFSGLKDEYHYGSWGNPEWSLNLNGSLQAGVTIALTGAILHSEVAAVDLTTYVGPKVSSAFTIESNEDMNTMLYNALKNVEVTASLGVKFEPGYRVWFTERKTFPGLAIDLDFLKTTRPLLPEISNPRWKSQGSESGVLTADLAKDTFIPVKLGWVLYDDTDNIHGMSYLDGTYWMENEWPIPDMSYTITDLSSNYNYKAYPVVRLFDKFDIRVPEYAEVKSGNICPDDHHPHMIDLGLPSGTKWACCNVGASKPEDYGGYYEWGQIADSPSLTQIQELLNSCSSVWTTLNGINGRLFTGPNGGQVFLPAAGVRCYGEFYDVGDYGDYWSGTPTENYDLNANGLYFNSGGVDWGDYDRNIGLSVRPVAR